MIRKASLEVITVMIVLLMSACGSDQDVEKLGDRSRALFRMGMNDEAMELIQKALEIEPERFELLETYWKLRFRQDEGAIERLKELESDHPTNPAYPRLLSLLLNDSTERLDKARLSMKLDPEEPEVYLVLSDVFIDMEMTDSAVIYCEKALELDPSMADASLFLGRLNSGKGDLEGAAAIYRAILDRGAGSEEFDEAVDRLFSLYWENEDTSGAIDMARTALNDVRDPWVLRDIAGTIAEDKIEIELAKALALKAIEGMNTEWIEFVYPEIDASWAASTSRRYRGYMYDTLGFVYYQAGETQKTINAYEEAITLIPYIDSEILMKLASAYEDLGMHDEAIESLLDVLAVSMNEEAKSRLESIYIGMHGDTTGVHALVIGKRDETTKPAADFEMVSMNGDMVSLSDFKGKVVLLNFWFPT
jgi:tetratricopeptide (TPR) repeat protein